MAFKNSIAITSRLPLRKNNGNRCCAFSADKGRTPSPMQNASEMRVQNSPSTMLAGQRSPRLLERLLLAEEEGDQMRQVLFTDLLDDVRWHRGKRRDT